MITSSSGVVGDLISDCKCKRDDKFHKTNPLESVGKVQAILEVDYGTTKLVAMRCKWAQPFWNGTLATIKKIRV